MGITKTIDVKVNAQQAKDSLSDVTREVIKQEQKIADLQVTLAQAEKDLATYNFKGYEGQLKLTNQIKRTKLEIKEQQAVLKKFRASQKQANQIFKESNKIRTTGTVKALQFNETLLKNRDITGGLSMLTGGYSSQIQKLGKLFLSASKGLKVFVAGLSTMKKVLLATGIGAVAIAIGAIVANFDKIKAFITGANRELEKLEQNTQKLVETTNSEITLLEKQKELLKLQGEDTKEINDKLKEKFELQKQSLLLLLEEYEAQQEINKENNKELTTLSGIGAILKANNASFLFGNIINSKVTKEVEKQRELDDKIRDIKGKILDLDIKVLKNRKQTKTTESEIEKLLIKQKELRAEELNNYLLEKAKLEDEFFQSKLSKEQQEINAVREKYFTLIQQANDYKDESTILEEAQQSEIDAIKQKYADKEIQRQQDLGVFLGNTLQKHFDNKTKEVEAEEKAEARKIALRNKTFNNAVKLAGEESRLGKAILVAKTILNAKEQMMEIKKTFMQAKSTVTGAVLKGTEAATAVAAGTAETAKIGFPQNIPMLLAYAAQAVGVISAIRSAVGKAKNTAASVGGVGGGGASIEAPQIPSAPPAFNVVGASGANQLATAIAGQQQQPLKTFVVSDDVSSAQELDRKIIKGATIG